MDLIYLVKREMLRRKYSHKTIKTYVYCLNQFLGKCHKEPRKMTKYDVKEYLYYLCEKGKSASSLNVNLQALKFAFENILNKRFFIKLPYSKARGRLPEVLTKEEVLKLINSIENSKHRLMVEVMYSSGLRVGELVKLKLKDFEFSKNYGWVRQGKGNKDRLFILAESIKEDLLEFIKLSKLEGASYLFKGRKSHITARTIQQIIKKAAKKARIAKNIHPHTLRHSFATHLIENGYDVATVQSLLGHNSAETTMVYVHMASPNMLNVKSPIEDLAKEAKAERYASKGEEN